MNSLRISRLNDHPANSAGEYVLYWMIANRRANWNYSLDRAVELASELGKPLVVFEALRCNYRWASERLHAFVIDGMRENAQAFNERNITYYPYLEQHVGQSEGLIELLAAKAVAVVTDDFPTFFLPRMLRQLANRIPCQFEAIDSNGILPMRATDKVFARAFDFRRYLQKELKPFLVESPAEDNFSDSKLPGPFELPKEVTNRWPMADLPNPKLNQLPINHEVKPCKLIGGSKEANLKLKDFLTNRFERYGADRNQIEDGAASGISPYLHFGHLSAHQVYLKVIKLEGWKLSQLSDKTNGSRNGWWGASETFESFIDEFITWRELGYNFCSKRDDYARYSSLPDWAKQTHADHADDRREFLYTLEEFENAQTHDQLWNAAQTELTTTGRMHNYLRMLWGKKIYEWSPSAKSALRTMIHLNNKYALDGRNPNSYSGIFWVLGRYDRAWGPERPVFGKIRYMSSDNTARKINVKEYVKRYDPQGQGSLF